jgi:hypothetical protein
MIGASSPAVVDGKIYIAIGSSPTCIDSTGQKVWSSWTAFRVMSSPAVAGNKLYVGSDDGRFYCMDATTGDVIQKYGPTTWFQSSPCIVDGKIYIGNHDNNVYCFAESSIVSSQSPSLSTQPTPTPSQTQHTTQQPTIQPTSSSETSQSIQPTSSTETNTTNASNAYLYPVIAVVVVVLLAAAGAVYFKRSKK